MSKYNTLNKNPCSVHQKIVQFVGKQKTVLDVGCAGGYLSDKLCKNKNHVIGIELDEKSSQEARKYCKEVIIGDIESIELKDKYINYFDFIIFADVLEHLKDPSEVLNRFSKYLINNGYIIISVPNIANWRIRLKLLMGNFDYERYGILDEGHLRFFTEKTARKLIKNARLEIYKFDVTVGDINRLAEQFHSFGLMWPNLLAYQFLIITKKSD